jgi:hypothetical protein
MMIGEKAADLIRGRILPRAELPNPQPVPKPARPRRKKAA